MAKNDFDEAIKLDKNDPLKYFNRGNVWLNKRMFAEALNDYDRAISLAPNNARFYNAKGLTYQGQAEKFFEETGVIDHQLNEKAIEMY